ncbi:odorant-binding protein 2a [Nycticebus coucang]|uniref:odorant-binding protein 2a n=1 Tax=Nycticebus coucang TaxID=9470 RepID=UPI00234DA340|nr:odorant-binding protein 2a [Nycticebus coucang]
MKALLLTAVLTLVAALSLALEHQDISGTWYVKAVVTDNDLQKDNRLRKVFPVKVTTLENGDMEVTVTFMKEDKCHQKIIMMQKTDEPGKYTADEGRKLLQVQKLLGTDDFVFYCEDRHHGRLHRMAKIMGRSNVTADPQALEEFKKFVQRKGLLEEAIFMPTQMESCVPAQG